MLYKNTNNQSVTMEEIVTQNYDAWNAMAKNVAYVAWAISILIVIYHVIRLATMNDAKLKYDYINRSEIRTFGLQRSF